MGMMNEIGRRSFLASLVVAAGSCAHGGRKRNPWMLKQTEYVDERTGVRVYPLVADEHKNQVVYQTHPMWTPDMNFLLFVSDRTGGVLLPHVRDMRSGKVSCVTPDGADDWTLSRKTATFFVRQKDTVYCKDVVSFPENRSALLTDPRLGEFGAFSMSIDADERVLYAGIVIEPDTKWGIIAIDLDKKVCDVFLEVDFRVGHVQANPLRSGVIMFCHETGGDAPQRTWVVNRDGSGLRPFYKETYDEWVTHEVWWGSDRAIFTIWPYDERHKQLPHGVVSADFGSGTSHVHSQFPAWHTHGSPDGRWAVADDFDGNIWLIRTESDERRLLTQGHRRQGFDTHMHPSFTPDSKGVLFNSSKFDCAGIMLAAIPDWSDLPLLG